jgi:serine/threonine protein kinase
MGLVDLKVSEDSTDHDLTRILHLMSEPVLKKFGRYFLLDQIGEGGMAEIFRARMAAPGESGRFVVIKRIQGANSDNPEFAQMFKAEVQVTMRFTHPNIVQLYESGEESGLQYIAMEWVEGRNLRQLLSKTAQRQQRIPISASCYMIEQVAAGLHYAHSFKDRITGEPLKLVHRDVSPQNILVSYDGNIKIIDFGIAKASTNGEATRAGVIKGKLSYLSPEQVLGDVLDGRSDLFALGIVLWELLTAKRLFAAEGENEFQVLKMIESCTTHVKPPSVFNPEVPPELDLVVMQALKRDPDKRFQTGEEFSRALKRILSQFYPEFGSSDLSTFVKKQFQDQIVDDRKLLQQLNGKAEELIAMGAKAPEAPPANIPGKVPTARESTRMTSFSSKFDKDQMNQADQIAVVAPPDRQMKIPAARVGAASGPKQAPEMANRVGRTGTMGSSIPEDPVSTGSGSPLSKVVGFLLVCAAAGFLYLNPDWIGSFRSPAGSTQERKENSPPSQAPLPKNRIIFRIFPDVGAKKARVTLNSVEVSPQTRAADLVLGDSLDVTVEHPDFMIFHKEFAVRADQLSPSGDYVMDVQLEPKVYGVFSLSTIPELAEVEFVNLDQGQSASAEKGMVFTTPIYGQKLPVGNYKVIIRNKLLSVGKVLQIEVKEGGQVVRNGVALEPITGKN